MSKQASKKKQQAATRPPSSKKEIVARMAVNQSEAQTYERAANLVKQYLDPCRDPRNLSRYTGTEPCTYFEPKTVFDLRLGTGTSVPFTVEMSSNLCKPLLVTDMTANCPKVWTNSITYDPRGLTDTSENNPAGAYERGAGQSCHSAVPVQRIWNARSFAELRGSWDPSLNSWVTIMNVPVTAGGLFLYSDEWLGSYLGVQTGTLFVQFDSGVVSLNFTSTVTTYGIEYNNVGITVPATATRLIQFWVVYQPSLLSMVIRSTNSRFSISGAVGPSAEVLWAAGTDIYKDVEAITDRYEVVSQTLLVSWQGSTLRDGGTIAGYRFPVGYVPNNATSANFQAVCRIPNSYNGPLKTGAWSFFLPASVEDLVPRVSHTRYHGPVNRICGVVDEAVERIQVTFVQKIRAVTVSSMFAPEYPLSDVQAHYFALNVLQGAVCCTENPEHLKRIAKAFQHLATSKNLILAGKTMFEVAKVLGPVLATLL